MIFFDFFGQKPRKLFLNFTPLNSSWRVISWNLDLKSLDERRWVLEVHNEKKEVIEWSRSSFEMVRFFNNGRVVKQCRIASKKTDLKELMNLSIHSTLKYSLESNHKFLLTPVSGANASDYQEEARALQWIQASFGTLTRALDGLKVSSDLILTAAIFSGIEPETGSNVLRIMAFNLDIFCYFQRDFSLQIAIFNDKDLGQGHSKTPSFHQIIKVTKPQIYDEIVKLVHRIATVGEIC